MYANYNDVVTQQINRQYDQLANFIQSKYDEYYEFITKCENDLRILSNTNTIPLSTRLNYSEQLTDYADTILQQLTKYLLTLKSHKKNKLDWSSIVANLQNNIVIDNVSVYDYIELLQKNFRIREALTPSTSLNSFVKKLNTYTKNMGEVDQEISKKLNSNFQDFINQLASINPENEEEFEEMFDKYITSILSTNFEGEAKLSAQLNEIISRLAFLDDNNKLLQKQVNRLEEKINNILQSFNR